MQNNTVVPWGVETDWVWHHPLEAGAVATPYLRLSIQVPKKFRIDDPDLQNQVIKKPSDFVAQKVGSSLIVDIPFFQSKVVFPLFIEKRIPIEVSINYEKEVKKKLLFHTSCLMNGVFFDEIEGRTEIDSLPVLAVTCKKDPDKMKVYISHKFGFKIEKKRGTYQLNSGKFRSVLSFDADDFLLGQNFSYPQFLIKNAHGEIVSSFQFLKNEKYSELNRRVGVGFGWASYYEEPGQVQVDQWAVVTSVGYEYLMGSRYRLDLEAHLTLTPLIQNPSNYKQFYFYGVKADLKSRVYWSNGFGVHTISGFVNENMHTEEGAFGYRHLYGLRFGFDLVFSVLGRRSEVVMIYQPLFFDLFNGRDQILSYGFVHFLNTQSFERHYYLKIGGSNGQYESSSGNRSARFINHFFKVGMKF